MTMHLATENYGWWGGELCFPAYFSGFWLALTTQNTHSACLNLDNKKPAVAGLGCGYF
jgi:hypothetical protein